GAHAGGARERPRPADGVLVQAVWFAAGPHVGNRLLLVVHHFAVDGVSWRILLADLRAACAALDAGRRPELEPAGTTLRSWARQVAALAGKPTRDDEPDRAEAPTRADELAAWTRLLVRPDPPLGDRPLDRRVDVHGRLRSVTRTASPACTSAALTTAPAAYRTGVDEILLSALALALSPWLARRGRGGSDGVLVALEGHGRDGLVPDADLSRTVGWFTRIHPVRLDPGPVDGAQARTGGPTVSAAVKRVKEQLNALPPAGGYGVLLAALGVGAVAGALVLPRVRRALTASQLLLVAGLVYGGTLLVLALVPVPALVTAALVPAGLAWMTVLSTVNAAMQLFLPGWVRARGLSVYQMVFAGGQALGALAWGALGELAGLVTALAVAGAAMAVAALTVPLWPLRDTRGVDRDPAVYWPEPHLTLDAHPRTGPVLVTVSYTVPPERQDAFVEAMRAVGRSRRRTGAMRWGLFRAGERAHGFVEVYQVPSWEEHLRQHGGRLTGADRAAEERARALTEGEVHVAHLLPADEP
ncbi:MFS transporter, partial [Micromonospora sp. DH15]|nr:MFS transporter [Micromonospora sp. DH15]